VSPLLDERLVDEPALDQLEQRRLVGRTDTPTPFAWLAPDRAKRAR
jgi:hypothetical protein